jgi:hypothetical protein
MTMLKKLGSALLATLAFAGLASAQTWQPLKHEPSFPVGAIALLTDGTVLLHVEQVESQAGDWYKLTPDDTGSYLNGTIKQIASLPSGYGPWYFGSVVLPDGRYIIEGGEYNEGSGDWTNKGAIYDPVKNKWTAVNPPSGWAQIGDAQSVILPTTAGTYMQADCCSIDMALFNPKTLKWTATGKGKADWNDEEGWTLLPDGNVLTVDAYVSGGSGTNSEIYDTPKGTWSTGGSTIEQLWGSSTHEVGPAVLLPNGTVFATGANDSGAGRTAIYNSKTKKWAKGPSFPTVNGVSDLDAADAPGALEINGNAIVMTSPGFGGTGAVFFEWNGTKLTHIAGPPNGPSDSSYYGHFLVLPTGELLFSDFSSDLELFTSKGTYKKAWAPTITSVPTTITHGKSYVVKGTQFGGESLGGVYGDDFQDATNWALVRITNTASGHVVYAKTTFPSSYSVQSGTKAESTNFAVPASIQTGASTLEVVTNGIPSAPVKVTVN